MKEKNAIDEAFINEINGTSTKKKIRLPLPGKCSSENVAHMRQPKQREEGSFGKALAQQNNKYKSLL